MPAETPADVRIAAAEREDADALADHWVALATDQRRHGSHLLADANRNRIREAFLQHVVTDTVFVAKRRAAEGDLEDGDSERRDEEPRESDGEDTEENDVEETIVGFVQFGLESERYQQDVSRGIVHNIYVRPEDRGQGIGSALLERVEVALADRGVDTVGLQAMATNERARVFYRQNGYAPHRVEYEKATESDSLTTDR